MVEKYSNTQKDMIAAIFKAINDRQTLSMQEIFGDSINLEVLDKLSKELIQYKKELQQAFNKMKDTMVSQGKYLTQLRTREELEKGDILSRISDLISLIDAMQNDQGTANIDIQSFFNSFFPNLDSSFYQNETQINAISQFIFKYQSLKDRILDTQELLGQTAEKIRGDKMSYGILLENANSQLKGKDAAKLLKLSREQFEQFERLNPDLFELAISRRHAEKGKEVSSQDNSQWEGKEGTVSRLQLRKGISSSIVYERMKMIFGENFADGNDILDQIYAVNSRNEAIKTRDVYNILFSNSLSKNENFKNIGSGRKLEMLFDPEFRNTILDYMENNQTINGNFSKQNLVTQLINFDTSKYKNNAENIYGHATGDVNFITKNGPEAIQLKFKNDFQPWNGAGIQGALDAINIIRTLYETMSNPNNIQNGQLSNAFMDQLGITSEFLMEDPRINSAIGEMAYQEAGDLFNSIDQEYTITGFI